LLLDLRFDVLKKITVTFPSEKVLFHRRPSGSHALRVTQPPPDTATHWLSLSESGRLNFRERRRHRQFRHPAKAGRVTVPHPVKDLKIGTLKSIEKQSGIKF
jgi:predicted RNA binding protein YcfA (HicA-like mRNA interferase family)